MDNLTKFLRTSTELEANRSANVKEIPDKNTVNLSNY